MDQIHIILILLNITWPIILVICIFVLKIKKEESDEELNYWRIKYAGMTPLNEDISNPLNSKNTEKMMKYCTSLQKRQYGQMLVSHKNDMSAELNSLFD